MPQLPEPEKKADQAQLRPWIVERSLIAALTGSIWTHGDHQDLLAHLRKVDELATEVAKLNCKVKREGATA